MFSVLSLLAVIVWINVLGDETDRNEAVKCPPPPKGSAPAGYEPLPYDALDDVTPQPPGRVQATVLNASEQRGQASMTTAQLEDHGFDQLAEPANDKLYANGELDCRAQIRFGENGAAAARTMSIVEPCAQLVRDGRSDASVDLVTGTRFDDLYPTKEATTVLDQLTRWAQKHPVQRGGEQSESDAVPQIDPKLLTAARDVTC